MAISSEGYHDKSKLNPIPDNDKLNRLQNELKSSLFPMHTKLFVERQGGINSNLLKMIMHDDLKAIVDFIEKNKSGINHDDLKELLILATFMGSINVFEYFKKRNDFIVDEDLINIALLSGELPEALLHALITDKTNKPSYGAIRFAIKSDALPTLKRLMESNSHLHFSSDHLTQAAAQNNLEIFNHIADAGVLPTGKFIDTVANKHPEIKARLDELRGNITKTNHP